MKNNTSDIFTFEEIEFLKKEADDYGWYAWTNETRSIIESLCARRLMAANGDFKVIPRGHVNLVGHASRGAEAIVKYFELIGEGRIAFHALHHGEAETPIWQPGVSFASTSLRR
jgi:hypothetical protein